MVIRYKKEQFLFLILFFLTAFTMLMSDVDEYSFINTLRKIKYVYLLIVPILLIAGNWKSGYIRQGNAYIPIIILSLHSLLFGYYFVSDRVVDATHTHAKQMLFFYLMVFETYAYIRENDLFDEFIKISFWASFFQLFIQSLKYRSCFVNPLWGIKQSFTADIRYKVTFGFTHAGWTSNAAYFLLIITFFYVFLSRKEGTWKKMRFIFAFSFSIGFLIITAAAERSGIIATCVFFLGFFVIRWLDRVFVKNPYLIILIFMMMVLVILIFVSSGLLNVIISKSNRMDNIAVNYPAFKQIGNLWTGMGFVESSGFQDSVCIYGVKTFSLDMYYPYIFFTTGLIGSFMVFSMLLYLLIRLFLNRKNEYGYLIFSLFISNLFFAIFQTNLFTYRYSTSFFITMLWFLGCDKLVFRRNDIE